ncbi:hypothetical protein C8Q73DRAFT_150383 [Cubamyces lactineus]|nr:hypothetical protein C8Q73DRAFT_150383 [Cubamyces lactineus]
MRSQGLPLSTFCLLAILSSTPSSLAVRPPSLLAPVCPSSPCPPHVFLTANSRSLRALFSLRPPDSDLGLISPISIAFPLPEHFTVQSEPSRPSRHTWPLCTACSRSILRSVFVATPPAALLCSDLRSIAPLVPPPSSSSLNLLQRHLGIYTLLRYLLCRSSARSFTCNGLQTDSKFALGMVTTK